MYKIPGRGPGYEAARKANIDDGQAFWSWSYNLKSLLESATG